MNPLLAPQSPNGWYTQALGTSLPSQGYQQPNYYHGLFPQPGNPDPIGNVLGNTQPGAPVAADTGGHSGVSNSTAGGALGALGGIGLGNALGSALGTGLGFGLGVPGLGALGSGIGAVIDANQHSFSPAQNLSFGQALSGIANVATNPFGIFGMEGLLGTNPETAVAQNNLGTPQAMGIGVPSGMSDLGMSGEGGHDGMGVGGDIGGNAGVGEGGRGGPGDPAGSPGDGPNFAMGGMVHGPGGPTGDQIPAHLSNGEGILNAGAMHLLGPHLLRALNHAGIGLLGR